MDSLIHLLRIGNGQYSITIGWCSGHKTRECEKVIADLKAWKKDCCQEKDHLSFILGLGGKFFRCCNQLVCLGFNTASFLAVLSGSMERNLEYFKMSILNFFKKVDKLTSQEAVSEPNPTEHQMDVESLLNYDDNGSMRDDSQSAEEDVVQEELSQPILKKREAKALKSPNHISILELQASQRSNKY
uniref:Uncharacterized protein n=1 Tax=Romanomermis culicivorax TaxID=13658 RepID=A0A915L0T0_ROMCU